MFFSHIFNHISSYIKNSHKIKKKKDKGSEEKEEKEIQRRNVESDIYIYIYIVLFGPVKPELGVIPSGRENHSRAEHLNFPGRELNVIDIYRAIFL